MTNEVTMLIAAYLKDGRWGLNTMLPKIARNLPGGAIDLPPRPCAIYNDVQDVDGETWMSPSTLPAIVVFSEEAADVEIANRRRQTGRLIEVGIVYVMSADDELRSKREGGYVLRAVRKCLVNFNDQEASKHFRELNDVRILEIKSATIHTVNGGGGGSQTAGFILVQVRAMDTMSPDDEKF